ncbi:radical SAM protein [Planctomycetota bacterium]
MRSRAMSRDEALPFPTTVFIQTTTACTSACSFCPHREVAKENPPGRMTQALYEKIILECAGQRAVQRIIPYLMNEPLCDPDIIERVNYAKDVISHACVHLITNGQLLSEAVARSLIESRVDWVGISVHALRPDTYSAISGGTDGVQALARIDAFVEAALQERGEEFLMINVVRAPHLLDDEEVHDALAHWRGLGVRRLEYYGAPISRAGNVPGMYQIRHDQIRGCKTTWGNESLFVLHNGDVVQCCMDWRRELVLGSAFSESLEAIWNGDGRKEVLAQIRGDLPTKSTFLCKRCEDAVSAVEAKPATTAATASTTSVLGVQRAQLRRESWRALRNLMRGNRMHFARGLNYFRALEHPLAWSAVCGALPGPILDVGSGDGAFAFHLARATGRPVHLAESPAGAAQWLPHYREHIQRDRHLRRAFRRGDISLDVLSAQNIPYPNDHFSAIACISVLEHNPGTADAEAVREMVRVLRPLGRLVLSFPVAWNGFFEDGQPGTASYSKYYDRKTIEEHILVTSDLTLLQVVHFGEHDSRIGRLWNRLPIWLRACSGLPQSLMAPYLWKVYRVAHDLDGMNDTAQLHRAGVVMLVLEKCSRR